MMRKESRQSNEVRSNRSASVRSATCAALMVVSAASGSTEVEAEREVRFKASDGWQITGSMQIPKSENRVPGVVLVHGSKHEKDAFGQMLPQLLNRHQIAVLRIDIRGRGASREPLSFHAMTPEQQKRVRLDIEAAVEFLASQPQIDTKRIAIAAEQDSADAAIIAGTKDRRVVVYSLLSGRLSQSAKDAIGATSAPIFCLVSKEDRRGFKDMADAYVLSKSDHSRLKVFEGIGFGTTMFSAWQYEFPDEQPIEEMIANWLDEKLHNDNPAPTSDRKKKR